ncbi:hypothetical protein [Xanthomonas arboricola]
MLAPTFSPLSHRPTLGGYTPPSPPGYTDSCGLPDDDPSETPDWTEEDIVYLHWRMLQQVAHLADPERPLDEKFDTLQWVFADQDKQNRPFSFVNCVRIVGCSPLSPIPYCGAVDVEGIRDYVRTHLKRWFTATLERYPEWVRQTVTTQPDWVRDRLARNPQWINEQVKRIKDQGDLFA